MDISARFSELAEDWRFYLRRDGVMRALPLVGLEIARLPWRHLDYLLVTRSLSEPLPDLRPKLALEIRPFTRADLAAAATMDRPSEARLCARRLAEGHLGLLALHEGRPVGYAWGCAEMDPELERVPLQLEPGDVLCTDVFTVPACRGQGVQTALTLERFRLFRDLGYRRAVCYIEAGNTPLAGSLAGKAGRLARRPHRLPPRRFLVPRAPVRRGTNAAKKTVPTAPLSRVCLTRQADITSSADDLAWER